MLAVVAVAGVAGYVCYWHAVEVVTRHGETAVSGHLYPVVIDGIIVAASMVVLDAARHSEDAPRPGVVAAGCRHRRHARRERYLRRSRPASPSALWARGPRSLSSDATSC